MCVDINCNGDHHNRCRYFTGTKSRWRQTASRTPIWRTRGTLGSGAMDLSRNIGSVRGFRSSRISSARAGRSPRSVLAPEPGPLGGSPGGEVRARRACFLPERFRSFRNASSHPPGHRRTAAIAVAVVVAGSRWDSGGTRAIASRGTPCGMSGNTHPHPPITFRLQSTHGRLPSPVDH